jgi:hypothetical protein
VEPGRVVDRAAEEAHDTEQQVRLPLGRRKRTEQSEYPLVARDGG